jgi:hypothetical protein
MTPTTSRRPRPRRWKLSLAALAATAALAGGGQLLAPIPAAAMIGNDPACTYQDAFWIDQFGCFDSNDDEGGAGGFDEDAGGRSIAPMPVAQPPKSPETRGHETVRPKGRIPDPPCDRANPCAKVGGPSVRRPGDHDAGRVRDEGRAHGSAGKPVPCQRGQRANGCLQMKCVVQVKGVEKIEFVDTQVDCRRLNREAGNETEEERELRELLCASLSRRIPGLQILIDGLEREILFVNPDDANKLDDLKKSRALRLRWLRNNEDEWLDEDCSGFPTPEDAEKGWE